MSVPLIFAALGGLLCERSGIATICLEGVMIVGAFTAATVDYFSHDPILACLAALAAGGLFMMIHALLTIVAKADQVISGVAINILAAGLTPLLAKMIFGSPTNTPSIPMAERLNPLLLIYVAFVLPLVIHYFLYRTTWGLRLLASGDGPEALRTSGVRPEAVRAIALAVGGAICGLGGAYLSIAHGSEFTRDMTAGRGYIALTALIFGKWKPLPATAACLFFGIADALQIQLQSTVLFGHEVPVQWIQAFPYALTLFILVTFVGKAKPPISIGARI
jgi:general nucleoside transport system permease protein